MLHRTYTKINTLYKRERDGVLKNCIIPGDFSDKATEYLKDCLWDCYEKVDGTNMSFYFDGHDIDIHGKTENAQISPKLLQYMQSLVTVDKLVEIFPVKYDENGQEMPMVVRIYGEGFGGNIQKAASKYRPDGRFDFIVFDISVNDKYLNRESVEDICGKLGLPMVPLIGTMTIPEAEEIVKRGFVSQVAESDGFIAEGLVCRPVVPLLDENGKRVIVKIKTCDYQQLENKKKMMK